MYLSVYVYLYIKSNIYFNVLNSECTRDEIYKKLLNYSISLENIYILRYPKLLASYRTLPLPPKVPPCPFLSNPRPGQSQGKSCSYSLQYALILLILELYIN